LSLDLLRLILHPKTSLRMGLIPRNSRLSIIALALLYAKAKYISLT
jgi:hypothetical protein